MRLARWPRSATSIDLNAAVRPEWKPPVVADLPGVAVRIGEIAAVAEWQLGAGLEDRAAGRDRLVERRIDHVRRLEIDGERDPAEGAACRFDEVGVVGEIVP